MAKDKPFNNPFGALKVQPKEDPAAKKPAAAPPPPPPKQKQKPVAVDEEAALFLEAVGAIAPVKTTVAERVPPPAALAAHAEKASADDSESLIQLAELVVDAAELVVEEDGELVEGHPKNFDARVMRKLKAGEFPAKAELDLHGLTREQARPQLEKFVLDARVRGLRSIRIITGRGLNSPDGVAVLRKLSVDLLTRGRLAKHVLAFCSAHPKEGGTGALDVLLRR